MNDYIVIINDVNTVKVSADSVKNAIDIVCEWWAKTWHCSIKNDKFKVITLHDYIQELEQNLSNIKEPIEIMLDFTE